MDDWYSKKAFKNWSTKMYQLNTKRGGLFSKILGIAAPIVGFALGGPGGAVAASSATKPIVEATKPSESKPIPQPTTPTNTKVPTLGTYASGGYKDPFELGLPGGEQPIPGVPMFADGGLLPLEEPAKIVGEISGQPLATMGAGELVQVTPNEALPGPRMPLNPDTPKGTSMLDNPELLTENFKKYQAIMATAKGVDVPTTDAPKNPNGVDTAFPTGDFDILGMRNLGDVAFTVASLVGAVQDAKRASRGKGPGALSRFTNAINTGIRQPLMERETALGKYKLERKAKEEDLLLQQKYENKNITRGTEIIDNVKYNTVEVRDPNTGALISKEITGQADYTPEQKNEQLSAKEKIKSTFKAPSSTEKLTKNQAKNTYLQFRQGRVDPITGKVTKDESILYASLPNAKRILDMSKTALADHPEYIVELKRDFDKRYTDEFKKWLKANKLYDKNTSLVELQKLHGGAFKEAMGI